MAKPAEKVGRGPCPGCGEQLTFKRSSGGLLNFACDCCDSSGYARPGGSAYAQWDRSIKGESPAPEPAPAPPAASPVPAPAPTTTPAKAKAWSMEDL